MNEIELTNNAALPQINTLELISREFNGMSVYGLEYILEDLFQARPATPKNAPSNSIDWFGLND